MSIESFDSYTATFLTNAAARGWTPADLRHHLRCTKENNLLEYAMYLAAQQLSESVNPSIRYAWAVDTHFVSQRNFVSEDYRKLWQDIKNLPSLSVDSLLYMPKKTDPSDEQAKNREKIAALLRKAESTPYEEEASTYIHKAAELQHKYNITHVSADLDQKSKVKADRLYISAPYAREKGVLLNAIASHCNVQTIALTSSGIICLVGFLDDIAYVKDMFASLERQCLYYMHNSPKAHLTGNSAETASFRRSFIIAYALRIGEILRQAEEESSPDLTKAQEKAVAIAESSVNRIFRTIFPHVSTHRVQPHNASGFNEGTRSAQASHFGGDSAGIRGLRAIGSL